MPTRVGMQPAEKLKREIARAYDRNPLGWNVLVGRDNRNFSQVLISDGSHLWLLKEEWINPYRSVGFGAKLTDGADSLRSNMSQSFGLRPLSVEQIKELATLMREEKDPKELFHQVMRSKPVSSVDLRSPLVLQGPVMASHNPLSLISDKHEELDRRLSEELEKLLLRKYPQTRIPYL